MSNQKLLMFVAAGLLTPAFVKTASAEIRGTMIVPNPVTDTAPVSGDPPRLRRTNEEQAGNEMPAIAMFADGKTGLYFSMTTELPGVGRANHRMQLSMTSVELKLEADKTVKGYVGTAFAPKFVTNNIGNEYRNANHPEAFAINNGQTVCAAYNYQPNNGNDTIRYVQCFNQAGQTVLPQTEAMAKNNDDCAMTQDGGGLQVTKTETVNGKLVNRTAAWGGCNGDGRDDGWLFAQTITCNADGSNCSLTKDFDVSLAAREERSHGMCSVSATDTNTAICTWTEGNNQPQRDGVWIGAVDITPGAHKGANQQDAVLWKQQIRGRVEQDGIRTYAMRMKQERILTPDATGQLVRGDIMVIGAGDLRGSNNNNNGKGGTYYRNQMAIVKATKEGLSYVVPMTDVAPELVGLDGTHTGMKFALLGQAAAADLKPSILFLHGSHTGGGANAGLRTVTWDKTGNKLVGSQTDMDLAVPYDRHLYPNYLGNNPGNQGRNYANGQIVKNPFPEGKDSYIMLYATTGKDASTMMKPEIKPAAYLSVIGVAQAPAATGGGSGSGSGSGSGQGQGSGGGSGSGGGNGGGTGGGTGAGDGTGDTGDAGATSEVGGCSTTGGSAGLASFLLIGLAAFRRRRS